MGQFSSTFISHSLEKIILEVRTLLLNFFFLEKCFYFYIYILTIFLNYTPMKMVHLPGTSPNMSSILNVYNRLGKTFLTSLISNHWATGGLWVNTTPNYNLSCVPARGEYNIADHTKGELWLVDGRFVINRAYPI